jgi:hypothetical protein
MVAVIHAENIKGAVGAVRNIKQQAEFLLGVSSTPFNTLQSRCKAMRDSHVAGLNPVFVGGLTNAQINAIFANHLAGWTGTPAQALNTLRAALVAFYGPLNTLFATLEDPVSIDAAGTLVYAIVTITSLHATLQAVLDAANVLEG